MDEHIFMDHVKKTRNKDLFLEPLKWTSVTFLEQTYW